MLRKSDRQIMIRMQVGEKEHFAASENGCHFCVDDGATVIFMATNISGVPTYEFCVFYAIDSTHIGREPTLYMLLPHLLCMKRADSCYEHCRT